MIHESVHAQSNREKARSWKVCYIHVTLTWECFQRLCLHHTFEERSRSKIDCIAVFKFIFLPSQYRADAVNYIFPFHSLHTAEVIMPCSYLQCGYPFKPLTTAKGYISSDGNLEKKILQKFTFENVKMLQISKYSNFYRDR